jgi:serine/threonine-protein kinase HipA
LSGEYRQAKIYVQDRLAGVLKETEEGYSFLYNEKYLKEKDAVAISLTMPLKKEEYVSNVLFPFFDGLIPEGWLLGVVSKNWKINQNDRFGLLLAACRDCIGDVSIRSVS